MFPLRYHWNVSGHDSVLSQLECDITSHNLSHAYLFTGPDHVGKYTAAQSMAGILQCPNGFCQTCSVCQEVVKGYHADTLTVSAEGSTIAIEEIRTTLEKLFLTRQSHHKVVLIRNIERMTPPCANALLKTLEDPPAGTVFLLTSSRPNDVLPTLRSRCRMVKFGRLSDEAILNMLQTAHPLADFDVLQKATVLAMGRPGKAHALLNNPELCVSYQKIFDDVEDLFEQQDLLTRMKYAGDLVTRLQAGTEKDFQPLYDFLEVFTVVIRRHMVNDKGGIFSCEKAALLAQQVQEIPHLLKRNVNSRLLLEHLMLSMS